MLILLIGVLSAIGAGAIGPALLISAASRWIPEVKRNFVNGIVNAGGSFGQFTVIPLAQLFIGLAGWQPAMVILGVIGLAAVYTWQQKQGAAEVEELDALVLTSELPIDAYLDRGFEAWLKKRASF